MESLSRAVRRNSFRLPEKAQPNSFIFVATVLENRAGKAVAQELFVRGRDDPVDMSTYMEKHTLIQAHGAPPGYIGFDSGRALNRKSAQEALFCHSDG